MAGSETHVGNAPFRDDRSEPSQGLVLYPVKGIPSQKLAPEPPEPGFPHTRTLTWHLPKRKQNLPGAFPQVRVSAVSKPETGIQVKDSHPEHVFNPRISFVVKIANSMSSTGILTLCT